MARAKRHYLPGRVCYTPDKLALHLKGENTHRCHKKWIAEILKTKKSKKDKTQIPQAGSQTGCKITGKQWGQPD